MTQSAMKLLLWRGLLVGIALVLIWRMVLVGLSEHFAVQSSMDTGGRVDRALAWNPSNPLALRMAAEKTLVDDAGSAILLAGQALRLNPADAWASVILAQAHLKQGDTQQADQFAQQALTLMPTRVSVLLRLAEYWDRRGDLGKTLKTLGKALSSSPDLAHEFYPSLLKLAEAPEKREAFRIFTEVPPVWWDGFYAYLAKRAVSMETVTVFTHMRGESSVPLSAEEREASVARLILEREWSSAYLLWVNGLPAGLRRYLGGVYNGGFEAEISNQGFDWHLPATSGVTADTQHTYGIQGDKALHLIFKGREFRFRHLFQILFLAPGDYEFISRARLERLQGRGGISWVIRCAEDEDAVLGMSGRLVGSGEWKTQKFDFNVPEYQPCAAQVLRLESQGNRLFDHGLEGEIWFDRIGIRAIRPE